MLVFHFIIYCDKKEKETFLLPHKKTCSYKNPYLFLHCFKFHLEKISLKASAYLFKNMREKLRLVFHFFAEVVYVLFKPRICIDQNPLEVSHLGSFEL